MAALPSMQQSNTILIRLPNWIGDTCMCLPALDLLSQSGVPFVVCARGWAKPLLAGLRTEGFIEMTDSLKANVQALRHWRQKHPYHQRALLMPDSFPVHSPLGSLVLKVLVGVMMAARCY